MNDAFKKAKLEVVQAVSYGVCKYKKDQLTTLVLDWFKVRVGFVLCQKHCRYHGELVGCCQSDWRVTYVGS